MNGLDPWSLIESGAPEDEYDTLTIKILCGIENEKTEVDIKKEIIDLLDNYYGSPIFNDLDEANQNKLKNDIDKLIKKIKKRTANNGYMSCRKLRSIISLQALKRWGE